MAAADMGRGLWAVEVGQLPEVWLGHALDVSTSLQGGTSFHVGGARAHVWAL